MDVIYPISNDAYNYLEKRYKYYVHGKMKIQRLGAEDGKESSVSKSHVLRLVSCSWLKTRKTCWAYSKSIGVLEVPVEWTHYGDGEEKGKIAGNG